MPEHPHPNRRPGRCFMPRRHVSDCRHIGACRYVGIVVAAARAPCGRRALRSAHRPRSTNTRPRTPRNSRLPGEISAGKFRRRGAVVKPCLSNTPQARCHASPETSRAPTSPVWSSRGFAESARRSHIGAARSPRCAGPTCRALSCRALSLPSTGSGCYSPIARPLPFSHLAKLMGSEQGRLNAALSSLETANAVKTPTRASPGW